MTATARDLARLAGPLRRALLRAARAEAELPDLPDAQVQLLRALVIDGAAAPGQLAESLHIARSTVSNLIKSLDAAGLIERSLSGSDGRSTVVSASPEAIALLARYDAAGERVIDQALAGLSRAERATVKAALPLLARVAGALAQHSA